MLSECSFHHAFRHLSEQNSLTFLPAVCSTGFPQCRQQLCTTSSGGCLRIYERTVLTDTRSTVAISTADLPFDRMVLRVNISCLVIIISPNSKGGGGGPNLWVYLALIRTPKFGQSLIEIRECEIKIITQIAELEIKFSDR